MEIRSHASTPACLLVLASLLLPAIADARGSYRRSYADEWRPEELREERREEDEKARQDWQEHAEEQQQRYLEHEEKQLDTVIDHYERTGYYGPTDPVPAAPAPKKGGACIYGADNQVLHQPDGVVCDRK